MKVEVKESKQAKERPFPKLMIGELGSIVLMTSYGSGIYLNGDKSPCTKPSQFELYNEWAMASFKDFEGSITLSND